MKLIIICVITLTIGIGLYFTLTNSQDIVEFNVGFSDPDGRTKYMMDRRGGSFDNKSLLDAKNRITRALNNNEIDVRDGAIDGWDKLGPYNMGGRIRAIAIDPDDGDHIFIGAAAGGIWESTNGGASWSLNTPFLDSYAVMDIQYHPTNPNVMLAVTGEYRGGGPEYAGIGVLRSLNGGNTWTKMNQPSGYDFKYLSKVRFHPITPSIVFVCGSKKDNNGNNNEGVIYKSTNDGLDWTLDYTETDTTGNIYDLEINHNNPNKMVFGNEETAYYSEDGGNTWMECFFDNNPANTNFHRVEVEMCKSDPSIVYALRYAILPLSGNDSYRTYLERSIDGGVNFDAEVSTISTSSALNILGSQGNYDNVLWVNDVNCNQVVMGGIDLWRYNVGGDATRISDWRDDIGGNALGDSNSVHADQHVIVSHPDFDNSSNTKVFFGNDGGIYKANNIINVSENDGWESLVTDLNITQFYGADVSYDGNTIVGGAQDNGYMFDNNSDDGLGEYEIFSTGDGGYCRIDKSNSLILYVTTQDGNLYKSENGGSSFCQILSLSRSVSAICCDCSELDFLIQDVTFIAPFIMDPSDSDHLLMGGATIMESTNGGDDWTDIGGFSLGGSVSTAMDISASDPNVIAVGRSSSTLLITTNGGGEFADWTQYNDGNTILPNFIITDVSIHPSNAQKIAVTFGGFHQTHLFITEDGGTNWVNRSLDFDMQVNTVLWHPELPDFIYIGTDIGIFASENMGEDWSINPYYSSGEGPVYVSVEELFWQGNGSNSTPFYLMAATHGRGIWRTEAPIRSRYYVDKNCFFCGENIAGAPFQYFENAVNAALPGSQIIFQSTGSHDEVPPALIVEKNLKIISENGSAIID